MKTRTAKKSATLAPLPPGAVLLSLDVSSSAIGWAIFAGTKFHAGGIIAAPSGWDSTRRIRTNTDDVIGLIEGYRVSHIALEWQGPYRAARGRNINGLAVLGQAQGHLLGSIQARWIHLPVDLIGERIWTRINGWPARKEARAERVKLLVPEYRAAVEKDPGIDKGLDISDAIGIALWRLSTTGA